MAKLSSSPNESSNLYPNSEGIKHDLEYDLRTTEWILKKVRDSNVYAQQLYAALCNNAFTKRDVIAILKEEKWLCSWRYAGGIIAHMRQSGDYLDWYCSGREPSNGFVPEGDIAPQIREDLILLGWNVVSD